MTATTTDRVQWVDRLRGLAIALMVLDHVLVVFDPFSPLRYTVTRLSLPLFMVAAGSFHRTLTARRLLRLAPAVLVEFLVAPYVLGTIPGIVTVLVLVLVVLGLCERYVIHPPPAVLLMLGVIQAIYVRIPWTGYQPGIVLAWYCLGRLAADQFAIFGTVPGSEVIGRRPMTWYVGHLVVLAAAVAML